MKSIKRFFWITLLLVTLGAGTYYPMSRHVVTYQSSTTILNKESWSFKDTFINLDKEPDKWCTVLSSATLSQYFREHHMMASMKNRVRCSAKSTLYGVWNSVKNNVKKGVNSGANWIKRESPKQLRNLRDKARQGVRYIKQKTKEGIRQMQK
ncbi:MAG: hypothetical protein EP343_06935 [Deltaproteobacteria bacterium]|nr:MAG: hypothetical protein EP343_06935 [Deltaproteobacteria bacterium]